MSDKKHIDRLFQEKLKDFEATPNDAIWKSIENKLHEKQRKRRVIPIWWQMAGVAAVLVLLLTLGNLVSNNVIENDTTKNPVVNTGDKDNSIIPPPSDSNTVLDTFQDENVVVEETVNDKNLNSNSNSVSNPSKNSIATIANTKTNSEKRETQNSRSLVNKNINVTEQTNSLTSNTKADEFTTSSNLPEPDRNKIDKAQEKTKSDVLIENTKNETKTAVTNIKGDKENFDLINNNSDNNTQSLEEAIAQANTTIEKEEGEKLSRWNISTNVAPVYFNSLGNGSPLDEKLIDNSKKGEINMSYGVNGSYAINEKLKIRAGINKVNLGYNVNDVSLSGGAGVNLSAISKNNNSKINNTTDNTPSSSVQNLSFNIVPDLLASNFKVTVSQELGFIELPIELEYSILNKKIGLNVIGGFSTLVLDNNKVYSTLNENKVLLGEAQNINNTSYSANFGLGLNYNVSEKIKFNLEPTFKYQINTFRDTSGDFLPYFIGFYTGLSYKF